MFPPVFRPAIKASTLFGDMYRQLLKADTGMRLWKYEIDTIVVTKHNRRLTLKREVLWVSDFTLETVAEDKLKN